MTDNARLFDAIRTIKGAPLTQGDVDLVNGALGVGVNIVVGEPDRELIAALKKDEGLRLRAYPDPLSPRAKTGKGSGAPWTAGYGRAHGIVEGQVIDEATAERWLIEDAREHNMTIHDALPWLRGIDPVRRRVIENMHFNMGWDNPKTPQFEGLSGFKNTLEAVRTGRYQQASAGMLASLWAKQVKGRAVRLAQEMATGRAS